MKKQMLNEVEIRKMMRFANIHSLTENFLTDKQEGDDDAAESAEELEEMKAPEDEDAEIQEEGTLSEMPLEDEEEDLEAEMPLGDEMPPEEEVLPEPEMGMEDELGAPAPIGQEELAMELASEIAQVLSRVLDVEVSADSDGEQPVPALDDEIPSDEMPEEEDLEEEGAYKKYDENFINEITRRVARRLLSLNKK